jgi:hypothetical protein
VPDYAAKCRGEQAAIAARENLAWRTGKAGSIERKFRNITEAYEAAMADKREARRQRLALEANQEACRAWDATKQAAMVRDVAWFDAAKPSKPRYTIRNGQIVQLAA